jgi:hypothetical protein
MKQYIGADADTDDLKPKVLEDGTPRVAQTFAQKSGI